MAAGSKMYYPQLRKLDFPIVRYPGGVSDALRQHREAVAHLLGEDESAEPYAGTSLALPLSPVLQSIFDFDDPLLPSDDDDDKPEIMQPASVTAAAHSGTDAETLRLVESLSRCQRRSTRAQPAALRPRDAAPEPSPSPPPSAPPAKKRKRARCADEESDEEQDGRDDSSPSPSAPPPKKQRKSQAAGLCRKLPAPSTAASRAPAAETAPKTPSARQRTSLGANIGQLLPTAVQSEVDFINGMPRLYSGWPSRNEMRKAFETKNEISRKSGYLMTVGRGGSLRSWFGDESVFEMAMWRWLVGEHDL